MLAGRAAPRAQAAGGARGPTALVTIASVDGEHFVSHCFAVTASVGSMKEIVCDACGIPVEQQRLLQGNRQLLDGETVLSLGMPTHLTLLPVETFHETPGTSQFWIAVGGDDQKLGALCELMELFAGAMPLGRARFVVYCRSSRGAGQLAGQLRELAEQLHGAGAAHAVDGYAEPAGFDLALDRFHGGEIQTLVATDAFPPRLVRDMASPPMIVNYDFPTAAGDGDAGGAREDAYGRRVFRTGRFSSRNLAVSLVTPAEVKHLRDVERFFCTQVRQLQLHLPVADQLLDELALKFHKTDHEAKFHKTEVREARKLPILPERLRRI